MGSDNKESCEEESREFLIDSNLLTFSYLVASTLLGVVVGGVLQYYITKKQDDRRFKAEEKKKQELDQKRMVTAYRRLKSFTDRIEWKRFVPSEGPARVVAKDELEGIEATLAQNYDVLDSSTIKAWDAKYITQTVYNPELTVSISFEAFLKDVKEHYEKYAKPPILPTT